MAGNKQRDLGASERTRNSPELLQTDTLYDFKSPDPVRVPVSVNNAKIEICTGAAASVISMGGKDLPLFFDHGCTALYLGEI